jgi:ribosomal protein S18 acetylase RimI-like enzyme
MNITIREAKAGDESLIAGLVKELAQSMGESSPITAGYVESYLSFPGNNVLLAEEDSRPIGLLSFSVRPNLYHAARSALIEEMIVHDVARGRGVGSALMTELFRRLAEMGCAEVSVSTMPDNEGALRFYRSHGLVDEAVFLERHF